MAEVLAGSSAVAGILSLTITVIKLSRGFVSSAKNSRKTIEAYFRELELLKAVLLEFKTLAENTESSNIFSCWKSSGSEACQEELERLRKKLQKRCEGTTLSQSLKRLTWPFSEEETTGTIIALHRHQSSLHAVLSTHHFKLSTDLLSEVKRLRDAQLEASEQVSYEWLSTANPALNHNFAQRKRSQGTGQWFLNSSTFTSWLACSCRSLWLHAIPGAGKTVLCSTIIDYVLHTQPDEAIAYFYFDFSDPSKQTLNTCLRSVLAQLCFFHTKTPQVVADLRSLSQAPGRNGFLDNQELLSAIISVCAGLDRSKIIVDALDEGTERQELTDAIKSLAASFAISLLVTSRREHDIEEALSDVMDESAALDCESVDRDIGAYVDECLRMDPKLKKRPQSAKARIKEVLTTKSVGMFRWVECQIEVLRSCLTPAAVDEALTSLPSTLDASYERALLHIHQAQILLARAALEFAIFCQRLPTIAEIAEAAAVGSYDGPFDFDRRLFEPEQILSMCASLLVLVQPISKTSVLESVYPGDSEPENSTTDQPKVRLAHYTVKEYLLSPRIRTGPASAFAISELYGNIHMARTCLRYLLLLDKPEPIMEDVMEEFPLSHYAADFWPRHVTSVVMQHDPATVELLRTWLAIEHQYYFLNSIRLSDPDCWNPGPRHYDLQPHQLFSPLYYICRKGACSEAAKLAIDAGADVNSREGNDGSLLQIVSSARSPDVDILHVLLEANADVNAAGGHYQTALNAAVHLNFEEVVALLLKAGADPNILLDHSNTTVLHTVSRKRQWDGYDPETTIRIMHRLLDAGADVNAVHKLWGSPLAIVAEEGNFDMVQAFLQAGADVNSKDSRSPTALISAAKGGNIKTLNRLLDAGAEMNVIGYDDYSFKTALAAAASAGNLEAVQVLLQEGADVNAWGLRSTTALIGAANGGHIEILSRLLGAGADVNVIGYDGYRFETALAAAARAGQLEAAELLLQAGAEVNLVAESCPSALTAAAKSGHIKILEYLLDARADVNLRGRNCDSPLEVAVKCGSIRIVQILLEEGADPNLVEEWSPTALSVAARSGRTHIVDCLLAAGADPDLGSWSYESSFQAALRNEKYDIYKRLIKDAKSKKRGKRPVSSERAKVGRPRSRSRRRASMSEYPRFANQEGSRPLLENPQSVAHDGTEVCTKTTVDLTFNVTSNI